MNRAEVKRRQAKALGEILTWIVLSAAGSLTGNNGVTYIAAAYAIFLLMWLPVIPWEGCCGTDTIRGNIKTR